MKKTVLAVFLILLLALKTPANAADDLDISISPSVLTIEALQPSTVKANITVQNMNENSHDFTITIQPLKQSDNSGTIEYVDIFNTPDPSIREKIAFFDEDKEEIRKIHLGPLEKKTLTMNIDINKETSSGDYYFSIIFMTTKDGIDTDTITTLPTGIATNVLLSVGKPGPATGSISSFSGPFFLEHGPVDFELLLSNTSDHFILPTGNVTFKNIFGQTVGKVDILPQYILSKSKRFLTNKPNTKNQNTVNAEKSKLIWKEETLLGVYTATAHIALSENGPTITKQLIFLAFPVIPALATTIIITVLLGIYLRVKKLL